MERVISLLREKNHYLEKFFTVNEHELINFAEGDFENVEAFYQVRDKILDLIKCIDDLLEEENTRTAIEPIRASDRGEIESLLKSKDEWVKLILEQDLEIISYIEKEKSNIIRELSETKQTRRAVGAYAQGAGRTGQLDEKA